MGQSELQQEPRQLIYHVPDEHLHFASAAITRLSYLFGGIRFTRARNCIVADADSSMDEERLRREIAHALYREKIYHETLEARVAMVRTLTGQ